MAEKEIFLSIMTIIIFFLSFKKNEGDQKFIILDKELSDELKGVAIIFVIFGHLCTLKFISIPRLNYIASTGPEIFLFLSGYGLIKSYLSKGIDKGFIFRRIRKVLFPYWIVTVFWIVIDFFVKNMHYTFRQIILSLLGINLVIDPTMWFISFILIFYILFYIIFSFKMHNMVKFVLLVLTTFVIILYVNKINIGDISYEYLIHYFSFPLGCLIALYFNKILEKLNNKIMLFSLFFCTELLCLILYFNFSNKAPNTYTYVLLNITSMFFVIVLFLILNYFNIESISLQKLGEISYYLYLFEGALMVKYNILSSYNKVLTLSEYLVIIYIYSLFLQKIDKFSKKFIFK